MAGHRWSPGGGARCAERPSPDDACLADPREDEVERPRGSIEVERLHERLCVLRLPSAVSSEEALQLRLDRPIRAARAASGASGTAAARPALRRPPRPLRRRARGSARPRGPRRRRRSRAAPSRDGRGPSRAPPARGRARSRSSSPASQRPASLDAEPLRAVASERAPDVPGASSATTATPSAPRSRPWRAASVSTATRSLTPSTSTTARIRQAYAGWSAGRVLGGAQPMTRARANRPTPARPPRRSLSGRQARPPGRGRGG